MFKIDSIAKQAQKGASQDHDVLLETLQNLFKRIQKIRQFTRSHFECEESYLDSKQGHFIELKLSYAEEDLNKLTRDVVENQQPLDKIIANIDDLRAKLITYLNKFKKNVAGNANIEEENLSFGSIDPDNQFDLDCSSLTLSAGES